MASMLVAAQFQGTVADIQQKTTKALEILYSRDIYAQLEVIPKSMTIRVLTFAEDHTKAKDALEAVFPNVARKLQIQVDSEVPLRMTVPNIIKPGQTALIRRSPFTLKLPGAAAIPLEGDITIGLTHLAVEWDGYGGLKIKDMGEGNGVMVGEVPVLPDEWMTIETGAKVRIGRTFLRFVAL